ncbi:MAG: transposase family protein [Thioploca sp.]|nr:transposase family protein [Thioploca sp.]
MKKLEQLGFLDILGQRDDPQMERNQLHPMPEILLLTLGAVICGSAGWNDIELFS